jgi:transcriptional regulator GlxA family with amidase domain
MSENPRDEQATPKILGVVLFDGFELLDVFGPLEMFGNLGDRLDVLLVAQEPGPVSSGQGPQAVAAHGFDDCPPLDLIMVPSGQVRAHLEDERLLQFLRQRAADAELTTTVCNGSHLLAATGLLDGRRATTNKMLFSQIAADRPNADWVPEARWVDDGDIVTASGVSAGMDMALHVVARLFGDEAAERLARGTEYEWHRDAAWDPFAAQAGLV